MDSVRLLQARAMGGVGGTANIRAGTGWDIIWTQSLTDAAARSVVRALLREDGAAIYGIMPLPANVEPWVSAGVIPIPYATSATLPPWQFGVLIKSLRLALISAFMAGVPGHRDFRLAGRHPLFLRTADHWSRR